MLKMMFFLKFYQFKLIFRRFYSEINNLISAHAKQHNPLSLNSKNNYKYPFLTRTFQQQLKIILFVVGKNHKVCKTPACKPIFPRTKVPEHPRRLMQIGKGRASCCCAPLGCSGVHSQRFPMCQLEVVNRRAMRES
jgi:hypothetical protein